MAQIASPVYTEHMARKTKAPVKVVNFKGVIRCASGSRGVLRQEVYEDAQGKVVKYNLAFIHHGLCQKDNGRVLGYDNAHGVHERHYMGDAEPVAFVSYRDTFEQFLNEVAAFKEQA